MTTKLIHRMLSSIAAVILFGAVVFVVKEEGPMAKTVYVVDVKTPPAPVFSDRCAVCMRSRPEPVASLALTALHGRMEYYFYGFTKPYSDQHFLRVPMHDSCIRGIRNAFAWRAGLVVVLSILMGVIVYVGKWGGLLSGITALLAFGMLLSFLVKDPMPVEYSMNSMGEMRFYFRGRACAEDFARRNHSAVKEGAYLTDYYPG